MSKGVGVSRGYPHLDSRGEGEGVCSGIKEKWVSGVPREFPWGFSSVPEATPLTTTGHGSIRG